MKRSDKYLNRFEIRLALWTELTLYIPCDNHFNLGKIEFFYISVAPSIF